MLTLDNILSIARFEQKYGTRRRPVRLPHRKPPDDKDDEKDAIVSCDLIVDPLAGERYYRD